jgi:DNA polymerase (family 10)
MTNRELARLFDLKARLMELHDENPFKIRSYQNAYNVIRQMTDDVILMDSDQLLEIKGIGKGIASDISEIQEKGFSSELNELIDKTPEGIFDLMKIRGLGSKKIRTIWKELSVESLGELEYAIRENRLTLMKGFGEKTQKNILQQIEFLYGNKGKLLLDKASQLSVELLELLRKTFPDSTFLITGDLRRMMPVVSEISIITDMNTGILAISGLPDLNYDGEEFSYKNFKILFIVTTREKIGTTLLLTTGPKHFTDGLITSDSAAESDIFYRNSMPAIPPYLRDNSSILKSPELIGQLVDMSDIKGVLHNHTVWSDGSDTILEMASYYRDLGYTYMLISDHSQSAFYANGIKEKDIPRYLDEIAMANSRLDGFRIFSGIESDILADGSLDYSDDILSRFDVVIASIHSGLRMDKERATQRLIAAIENPFTRMLGHISGRILLSREGYPLDYMHIFESCAKNNVAIEFNANPLRLDIGWEFIDTLREMGIKSCINPDAHSKTEVRYLQYATILARKGGLLKENCINAMDVYEFDKWIQEGKIK